MCWCGLSNFSLFSRFCLRLQCSRFSSPRLFFSEFYAHHSCTSSTQCFLPLLLFNLCVLFIVDVRTFADSSSDLFSTCLVPSNDCKVPRQNQSYRNCTHLLCPRPLSLFSFAEFEGHRLCRKHISSILRCCERSIRTLLARFGIL